MTDLTSAPQIQVGTFLIAPGTPLPAEWVLSVTAFQSGSSVLPGVDLIRPRPELVGTGWTFFFMAGEIYGTGPRMLAHTRNIQKGSKFSGATGGTAVNA